MRGPSQYYVQKMRRGAAMLILVQPCLDCGQKPASFLSPGQAPQMEPFPSKLQRTGLPSPPPPPFPPLHKNCSSPYRLPSQPFTVADRSIARASEASDSENCRPQLRQETQATLLQFRLATCRSKQDHSRQVESIPGANGMSKRGDKRGRRPQRIRGNEVVTLGFSRMIFLDLEEKRWRNKLLKIRKGMF